MTRCLNLFAFGDGTKTLEFKDKEVCIVELNASLIQR